MGSQFHYNHLEGNKSSSVYNKPSTMNRFLAIFALVSTAFAEPEANAEADPQLLVYGAAHTTGGLVHHSLSGAVVPDETPAVKAATVQHLQAKAQHLTAKFGTPYIYPVIKPAIAVKPVLPAKTVTYATSLPLTYNYPAAFPYTQYHGLVKRDADAEAEADPAFYYNNAYRFPYTGTYGTYAYPTYTYPAYSTGYIAKTVVPYTAKTVLPSYTYPTYTSGLRVLHKREAEAEADPYTLYTHAYGLNHGLNYGLPCTTGYTRYNTYQHTYKTVGHSAYTYPYLAPAYHY